jgi:hypothetical protein
MKTHKQLKPGQKMYVMRPDGFPALRVWHRKGRAKQSPRLRIKCGDCENALEVFYDEEALEIGGVHGSSENWREILLPLLRPKARK